MIVFSYINTLQLCTLNLLHLHSLHWLCRLKCTCSTVKGPINLLRFPAPFLPFYLLFVLSTMFKFSLYLIFLFLFLYTVFGLVKKRKSKWQIKTLKLKKMTGLLGSRECACAAAGVLSQELRNFWSIIQKYCGLKYTSRTERYLDYIFRH